MGENTAPIQSADLSGIIEWLENATGPDRGIDAKIAAALEPHLFDAPGFAPIRPIPTFRYDPSENVIRFEGGGLMDVRFFPPVTASVDAAIALAERVLPGWRIAIEHGDNYSIAQFKRGWGARSEALGVATTERPDDSIALCLVTATLRALQSKGEA